MKRLGNKVALTFEDRVKLFEEDMSVKNKQAGEFVRKMQEDRYKRDLSKQQRHEKELKKMMKQQQKIRKMQENRENKKKHQREEHMKQLKKHLEEKEMMRQVKKKLWRKQDKEFAQKQIESKTRQTKYEENILLPEIEQFREIAKQKKEYFKPIDIQELKEHEKKYHKLLREKLQEK